MIVKKKWLQKSRGGMLEWPREGWYLFGVIPLYVRDCRERGRF
jgi:hypothetical protein